MASELLDIDDPLLPRLRRAAMHNREAHRWLLDSTRRWARTEFIRREIAVESKSEKAQALVARDEYIEKRVAALRLRQVAVLVEEFVQSSEARIREDRIFVGFLRDDCTPDYLSMWVGVDEPMAGLQSIRDIFELPKEWRTQRWPTKADEVKPSEPSPGVGKTALDYMGGRVIVATDPNVPPGTIVAVGPRST